MSDSGHDCDPFLQLVRARALAPDAVFGATLALHRYRLRSAAVDCPVLALVLQGKKRIHLNHLSWDCAAGEFLFMHKSEFVDIENTPLGEPPLYFAWVTYFSWRVIDLARAMLAPYRPLSKPESDAALITVGPAQDLREPVEALLAVKPMSDGKIDPAELEHRLVGILIALAKQGHTCFLRAADPSLSARIRMLIAANPARDWVSAQFEDELHVSGATLRRRLSEEGTSLRALLREARLHHGLSLLQTTRKPLKTVAFESGYRSVPNFSRNFAERFGVEPSTVARD